MHKNKITLVISLLLAAVSPIFSVHASCIETSTQNTNLWIPPLLTGTTFDLSLMPSAKNFLPGKATQTIAYNCNEFLGPTLLMNKGQTVTLHVSNRLSETTTTHWHGMHLPAEMDGGPMQLIEPGATWSPSFKVTNHAATYWYHPHMHENTMTQLNQGAAGLIIIKDTDEAKLALPRTYGVDDIPVVMTSRSFGSDNAINTKTIYGDYMLTNGVINAEVTLPAQVIRLRLLNTEVERAYNLGFKDNRNFYVIATDGGLVTKPVAVKRLLMLPGERYEVLLNLTADKVGNTLDLQAFNGGQTFGFPGGEAAQAGTFGSLLNNKTFNVLHITVGKVSVPAIKKLPTKLVNTTYLKATDATNTRTLAITDFGPGTPFTFNNAAYDMDTINHQVKLNSTEKWTISNGRTFGHSFHIHDVQFSIVSRSSGPIPDYEKGWKDTFFIRPNEKVSFVAKFADYASTQYPFMYHCHMANHEDEGLMGQFLVIP